MIVLDTNVISALMQARPDGVVTAWLDAQPPESIWTSAITIFEIRDGIARLPKGKRRSRLGELFQTWLDEILYNRVLSIDTEAASHAADIAASLHASGQTPDVRDVLIAGVVRARRATLATRNLRHFQGAGIAIVNPWGGGAG